MRNLFLQIVTDPAVDQVTSAVAEDASKDVTLYDLVMAGGWVMIPLFLLSIAAVYILIERYLTINKASKGSTKFVEEVKEKVAAGKIEEAKLIASKLHTPASKMIAKGLSRIGSPLKTIEASIENVGKLEINRLEKNLSILATISGAAPMIGFLGTVMGMIQAFISIAQEEGTVSPKLLSAGIYEAMITTAAGLIVGIIAYVAYNYLSTQIQKIIHAMEYSAIEFVELLQDPR